MAQDFRRSEGQIPRIMQITAVMGQDERYERTVLYALDVYGCVWKKIDSAVADGTWTEVDRATR